MQSCWQPQPTFVHRHPWKALKLWWPLRAAPAEWNAYNLIVPQPSVIKHGLSQEGPWLYTRWFLTMEAIPEGLTRLSANSPPSNWCSYPFLKGNLCTMSTCVLYMPYCIHLRDDSRHCFQDWKTFYYISAVSVAFSLQNIPLWGWGLFQVSQVRGNLVQVKLKREEFKSRLFNGWLCDFEHSNHKSEHLLDLCYIPVTVLHVLIYLILCFLDYRQ